MATTRIITSAIWRDEWFGSLDFFQQAVWIGLFSGCADDQGRIEDNPCLIRSDLFPYKDISAAQIDQVLEEFADAGKLVRYSVDGHRYIQIVNWWDHQRRQWAQPSKFPAPPEWNDSFRAWVNKKLVCQNWPQKSSDRDDRNGGGGIDNDMVDAHVERHVGVQGNHGHDHDHGHGSIPSSKDKHASDLHEEKDVKKSSNTNVTTTEPPPIPPQQPQKPKREPKPKAQPPPVPPAIVAFRQNSSRYPPNAWRADIIETVGDDPAEVERWGKLVKSWCGHGYNPQNVENMLECFRNRETLGTRKAQNGTNRGNTGANNPTGTFFGDAKRDAYHVANPDDFRGPLGPPSDVD